MWQIGGCLEIRRVGKGGDDCSYLDSILSSEWILRTGFWDDTGIWIDAETWSEAGTTAMTGEFTTEFA